MKQKASVVSKSTLIFNLAIPRLEEACGKEKKMRGVIFLTFAIWGPGLFFMQTLWFWISPLCPLTPAPLQAQNGFFDHVGTNVVMAMNQSERSSWDLSTSRQKPWWKPLSCICPPDDLFLKFQKTDWSQCILNSNSQAQMYGKRQDLSSHRTFNFMDLGRFHRSNNNKEKKDTQKENSSGESETWNVHIPYLHLSLSWLLWLSSRKHCCFSWRVGLS